MARVVKKKRVEIEGKVPQVIENTYRKNVHFSPLHDIHENKQVKPFPPRCWWKERELFRSQADRRDARGNGALKKNGRHGDRTVGKSPLLSYSQKDISCIYPDFPIPTLSRREIIPHLRCRFKSGHPILGWPCISNRRQSSVFIMVTLGGIDKAQDGKKEILAYAAGRSSMGTKRSDVPLNRWGLYVHSKEFS